MKPIQIQKALPLIGGAAKAIASDGLQWPAPAAPVRDSRKAASVRLTPRELDVLTLLCAGLSNKLICKRLDVAPGTVKVHVGRILRALGVTTRLQAVVSAWGSGLVQAPGGVRTEGEAAANHAHGDCIHMESSTKETAENDQSVSRGLRRGSDLRLQTGQDRQGADQGLCH